MTITIAPTDFTNDIVDTVKPLLDAVGLLDSNGNLDIQNWNAQKAMGIFETYERTETILDLISGFTDLPQVFYRQKQYDNGDGTLLDSGLLFSDNNGDTQGFEREEWFKIYPFDDSVPWAVYLTVIHTGSGSDHEIKIGAGFSYLAEITGNELDCRASIPIMKIAATTASGIITTPLFWAAGDAETRTSISASLSKVDNTPYSVDTIECKAISLQTAIGQSGAKVVLTLEDYGEAGGNKEDMVIDSWAGAGGFVSNILNGIVDLLLGKIPDGRIKNDLLPLLGLLESSEHIGTQWPELDIMELISHIDDAQQLWGVLKSWLNELIDDSTVTKSYLKHIYRLITGEEWGNIPVTGSGTKDNPWKLILSDGLNLDLQLIVSTYIDADGTRWIDFGVQAEALPTFSGISLIGGATVQLFSIPLSNGASAKLLPQLEAAITLQPEYWNDRRGWGWDPSLSGVPLTHHGSPPTSGAIDSTWTLDTDADGRPTLNLTNGGTGYEINDKIVLKDVDDNLVKVIVDKVSVSNSVIQEYHIDWACDPLISAAPLSHHGPPPASGASNSTWTLDTDADGRPSVTLVNGGTGYAVHDELTLKDANHNQVTITVEKVDNNTDAILDFHYVNDKLVFLLAGNGSNPLNNLSLLFERGKAALRMDSNRDLSFALELLQVDIDDTHWDVLDLTSADTPADLLSSLLTAVMDIVSDYFSDGGLLQWIGSLFGLCSPRCNTTPVLVNSAPFAWDWYGKSSALRNDLRIDTVKDLRIDIVKVISDPLCALTQYHANLLATPITICTADVSGSPCNSVRLGEFQECTVCEKDTDLNFSSSWVYIMEALGNIINTAIRGSDNYNPPLEFDVPTPLGSDLTLFGTESNPWKVSLTSDGDIPGISLVAWKENQGNSERLVMGVQLLASMLYINEQMQLTAEVSTDLLDITLPTDCCQIDEVYLFTSVSAAISIKNALHIVGDAPDYRIEIEPISGVHASIESITASAYWTKNDGFGWDISLVKPGIKVFFPNWSSIISMIKDPSNIDWDWPDLDFFHWDGFNLHLPDGSIPSLNFNNPFPWNITIPRIEFDSGMTVPGLPDLTIPFTGFNLGWPWFTGAGGDGKFGFGFNGFNWPNIDFPNLFPIDFDISLPVPPFDPDIDIKFIFRILLGKWLSFKFGKFGLFLSGFFKLNIDLPNLNLDLHLKSFGGDFSLPEFDWPDINLPSGWLPNFQGGGGGLLPFHLPIDWPEIDWPNFDINNPWPSIKKFLIDLFSGISFTGEPFAFPALRWIWGLFNGSLPDLRLPDLGWGDGNGGGGINFPNVPLEISGDGSYDNPWAIPLGPLGMKNVEFIVWLDPDGLPSSRLVDLALAALDPQLLDMIENGINSIQTSSLGEDWPTQVSNLLLRIKNISPKVRKALDGIDESELREGLETFNNFLTESDGLVPMDSQSWGATTTTQISTHWNALETSSVITDIVAFLTPLITSNTKLLLIQAPWSDGDAWDSFISQSGLSLNLTPEAFDFTEANVPNVTLSSIDISGVQSADIYTLKLAQLNPDSGMTEEDYQISQIEKCVNHILYHTSSAEILIVGHSIGGLAARMYHDSSSPSSSVTAVCTVATPHDGFLLNGNQEAILKKIAHILELLGFGGRGQSNTSLPDGTLGENAGRKDVEKSITMLTQNREGIIPDIGGGN